MSTHAFLLGGGREPEGSIAMHNPFADAVAGRPGPVVAYLLEEEGQPLDLERWEDVLTDSGIPQVQIVAISAAHPPRAHRLDGAAGVYVCGGWTPGYADVLREATEWREALAVSGLPYAGFSAGAAVVAKRALVGGWRGTMADGELVEVCAHEAGEELDRVELRGGLGFTEALVEVHCAQWGTLPRLLHALRATGIAEGFGIDEHTVLELRDGAPVAVHGRGVVHHARLQPDGAVAVSVLQEGPIGGAQPEAEPEVLTPAPDPPAGGVGSGA